MRPPSLRSIQKLGENKPHGSRLRYMSGCKCMLCRAANSRYECARAAARKAGEWNGIVPANRARRHLRMLSRYGVGRRSVHLPCDIAESILHAIKIGKRPRIRAHTERAILGVSKAALGEASLAPAEKAWKQINKLLEEGFSKAELARRLGYQTGAMQFRREKMIARSVMKIDRLYHRIMDI